MRQARNRANENGRRKIADVLTCPLEELVGRSHRAPAVQDAIVQKIKEYEQRVRDGLPLFTGARR